MKLEPDDLREIAARTLSHYDRQAEEFRDGTRDHDVSQNVAALLRYIEAPPPFAVLDLGCGPGRDLVTFTRLGHRAIGLDGAARFVAMARAASGCTVWQQDFLALDLPERFFDGVFANAALFHVPSQELPRVLGQLRDALRPGGVLFSSNPRGANDEGWNRGRYGVHHDLEAWRGFLSEAGFVELEHYYRPAGLPRERQPWLATVWRRVDGFRGSRTPPGTPGPGEKSGSSSRPGPPMDLLGGPVWRSSPACRSARWC
jgi:SAM-dependent methyltransferase